MAEIVLTPDNLSGNLKIIAGEATLDGSNPTPVNFAGKLSRIDGVHLTLKGNVAPALLTSVLTYDIVGSRLDVYAWMPTSVTNPTLIASTGTQTFSYVVAGN